MPLGNLDPNGIGRYDEATPIGTLFSTFLNLALDSVSAVISTILTRLTGLEQPPLVILGKSASQALTVAEAALTWDVETKKTAAGMHSNVTAPTRVTCTKAGVYLVNCTVYNNNTTGIGTLRTQLNGTTIPGAWTRIGAATAGAPLNLSFLVDLAVGNYLEVVVSHTTATGFIESTGGATAPSLSVTRVG